MGGGLKTFSSVFPVNNESSRRLFQNTIKVLGLENFVKFESIEENCKTLIQNNTPDRETGPEGSKVINVPGKGDCWLIAYLAPLLGFIVRGERHEKILQTVRTNLSIEVLKNPEKYKHIFASKQGLEEWCCTVSKMREWDGDDAFSVLVELTRICIHVISTDFTSCQAVRSYTPRGTEGRDWETSIAVVYGSGHYRALIPVKLPMHLNLTDKLTIGPLVKVDLESEETDGKWKTVEKPKRQKFPRNSSQKDKKYEKQKKENRVQLI